MLEFFTNNFWTITLSVTGFWALMTILEKIVTKHRLKKLPKTDEVKEVNADVSVSE